MSDISVTQQCWSQMNEICLESSHLDLDTAWRCPSSFSSKHTGVAEGFLKSVPSTAPQRPASRGRF